MTPEAQRIAIAEACGWKMITTKDCGQWPHGIDPMGDRMHTAVLPDYLTDLNAMHEAEKVLTFDQALAYTSQLSLAVSGQEVSTTPSALLFPHCATAAQRAEAFLRTIGKWEDDK